MKVTYFYRPRMKGTHSIEAVFDIIKSNLPPVVRYTDYICTTQWKRLYSFFKASEFEGDINHITGDIHTIALFLKKKERTIITVHDIGHYERDLTGIKKALFKLIWMTLPLKRVTAITTISNFTKDKLVEHAGIDAGKITVIPNPATLDFSFSPLQFNEKEPWVLQIGGGNNKNIFRLIEAVKGTPFRLMLIRKPDAAIKQLLEDNQIIYEWHSSISREEVHACYQKCDILFFASEYEGFGVPILEANVVGRPIITSNISSMPDVAADAAVYVDPYAVDEIKAALYRLKDDASLREQLIKNGLENVKRFAAEKIALQYVALYNDILDRNK